jgi:hypothetical protein
MSEPFVPLAKAPSKTGPAGESFRLTVLPQSQLAAPFLAVQPGSPGASASPCAKEPQITLERNGDCITRIKIQCTCGQILELNCTY